VPRQLWCFGHGALAQVRRQRVDGGKSMINGSGPALVLGFALLLIGRSALSVEPLSTEELATHCKHYTVEPVGEDAAFCVRYIQGFIDGAVATDGRVTRNVSDEYEKTSAFSERAMRTRLGSRLDRYGPSYYAEFCLGAPVPLKDVVETVVKNVLNKESAARQPLARELVYETLRDQYPCGSDES
jgi:hypothetical protein